MGRGTIYNSRADTRNITNKKGGVGKTTSVVNLAAARLQVTQLSQYSALEEAGRYCEKIMDTALAPLKTEKRNQLVQRQIVDRRWAGRRLLLKYLLVRFIGPVKYMEALSVDLTGALPRALAKLRQELSIEVCSVIGAPVNKATMQHIIRWKLSL